MSPRSRTYDVPSSLKIVNAAKKALGLPIESQGERPRQLRKGADVWRQAADILAATSKTPTTPPSEPQPTHHWIADIDWQLGDDDPDPIVKSPRSRKGNDNGVRFQRYQFKLSTRSGWGSRWNRGFSPTRYTGNGDQTVDRGGARTPDELDEKEGAKEESRERNGDIAANRDKPISIAAAAQSMPKGFSTGVLTSSFDFTNPPRQPTTETAWIYNDNRFRFFIVRKISREALAAYERDPTNMMGLPRLFGGAIKAYVNLYNFFRIGQSDQGFLDDPDLAHVRLWLTPKGRRSHRSRLCQEGLELFGLPPVGKPVPDDYDETHVRLVWPILMKVFRAL